jgi:amino acid transporter
MFRRPRYKKDTVLLSTVLFGITFICVANTAGNSINFALRALQATYPDEHIDSFSPTLVRGLAILVATFACVVHGVSRRGGIWLSNIFAVVKILILLLIIFTAAAAADGKFKDANGHVVPNVLVDNTNKHAAFADAYEDANGYARAFLAIIFAYSGFDQPNYVCLIS